MKSKGKNAVVRNKEEIAESWCFICKDGGDLRICDHKQCTKSFHPSCVEKDDAFLGSDDRWVCSWHTCFLCHRSSQLHCYTCINAVCRRCFPAAAFSQVKGKYGFCKYCLKLAVLIEEEKDYDSDGDKVDFADLETYEGLFMEYYCIIKKEEGLESRDICAARERLKMKKGNQSMSGSEDYDEDEDQVSDYDGEEFVKKCKRMRKGKRSEKEKPGGLQTSLKTNKVEFVGWASRPLIDFLTSIGKATDEEMSQRDVTSIINDYVKENKLLHQERKKMIMCDARLQSLFRKKMISKNRVYELVEAHLAENHDESEEDESDDDSEDESACISNVSKRQRKLESENKSTKKELEEKRQSCFASIVVENIKLVYLKKSLLIELLKQLETFEEKVIGSFVRVKSDPHDYLSRNSHQLMQVEGVKTVSNGENNMEVFLLFSAMPKEISINLLSDGDFSKEECEDLRQKMLAGQLKRPTVGNLQQKAKILHKDLTKHWINKELALLKNLIDRANEKGWRRQLFEYLERRKMLQTPSEQTKLFENVPKVIPDVDEQLNFNSGDIIDEMNSDKGSPQSILRRSSSVSNDGCQDDKASEDKTHHAKTPAPERKQLNSEESIRMEPTHKRRPDPKLKHGNATSGKPAQVKRIKSDEKHVKEMSSPAIKDDDWASQMVDVVDFPSDDDEDDDGKCLESEMWCILGPDGEREKCSLAVLRRWAKCSPYAAKYKAWREDENEENAVWLPEVVDISFPKK